MKSDEHARPKTASKDKTSLNYLILIALVGFAALYVIVNLPLHWAWKFALGIGSMYVIGQYLIKKYGFTGEHGLILLKSKHGLKLIKSLAVYDKFWKFFSEAGTVASYGAFAFILLPKQPSLKAVVAGFVLLTLIMGFVGPLVLPFLANTIGIPVSEKSIKKSFSLQDSGGLFFLVPLLILYGGGMFAVLLSSVILYGAIVLVALQNSIFLGTSEIAEISPGVAPLLPGINLPFVESLIALFIILVVHEGAHAVLACIARVPILSSGIVLFGVIPIGAFVEPDEEYLKKIPREPQTAVVVAGSAANLVTSVLFFILFILFLYFAQPQYGTEFPAATFSQWWMKSIYITLGLCYSLNFAIGTVNLLPLPLFDGYRALEINLKNKTVVDAFMAITAIAFLVNLIPWLFR